MNRIFFLSVPLLSIHSYWQIRVTSCLHYGIVEVPPIHASVFGFIFKFILMIFYVSLIVWCMSIIPMSLLGTSGSFQMVWWCFVPYGKLLVLSENALDLFPELFPKLFTVGLSSTGSERCYMICLRYTWVLEISDVTYWKDYRVMLLDTE